MAKKRTKRPARARRAKKPKLTAEGAARIAAENERVETALRKARYKTFEGFLARNSTLSLREMARRLGVPEIIFFGYHSRWIDAHAQPRPDVAGQGRTR